ncbi:MAG: ImmA/IrrE family metallo-endopeptidase, partial [Geobacteraceae bacterium]|nr:ImmA/IrrE family metallo-endopeptidase [Geobacteraceae bacterium]
MEQMKLLSTPEDETAKSLLSNLLDKSRLYHQSKDYKELLDFITRLRNFAPFNAFLLNLQKPGLRFAASQYDWRQRFEREVKEGARPLIILWPFSPVALVYDVDDTEGEPLPDTVLQAFRAVGELTINNIIGFISLLQGQGIELRLIEYGDAHAGHIQTGQKPEGLEIGLRSTDTKKRPTYFVRVNSKHDPNVQFVTLVHELAHLYLGHLGPDKYLKIAERSLPKHEQE